MGGAYSHLMELDSSAAEDLYAFTKYPLGDPFDLKISDTAEKLSDLNAVYKGMDSNYKGLVYPPIIPSHADCVRYHLNFLLPLELVDLILTFAHISNCACLDITRHLELSAEAHTVGDFVEEADRCYLLTPPVPESNASCDVDDIPRIKTVRIVTTGHESPSEDFSHDSDENADIYSTSTWFEAAIIRPKFVKTHAKFIKHVESDAGLSTTNLVPWLYSPHNMFGPRFAPNHPAINLPSSESIGRRWLVNRNRVNSDKQTENMVIWSDDDLENTDAPAHSTQTEANGLGLGHGFVHALKGGDRIAIFARSSNSSQKNILTSARVEILYSNCPHAYRILN